jgi:fluoride exporter
MTSPAFLQSSLLVALGGGAGAWLRYCTGIAWSRAIGPVAASAFPWATLTVNLLGSVALGVLAGWFARYGSHTEGWRLFLAVGVLGGFTTFSAFSLEMVLMIERGTIGQAGLYAAVSLLAGIGGLFLGLTMMRTA